MGVLTRSLWSSQSRFKSSCSLMVPHYYFGRFEVKWRGNLLVSRQIEGSSLDLRLLRTSSKCLRRFQVVSKHFKVGSTSKKPFRNKIATNSNCVLMFWLLLLRISGNCEILNYRIPKMLGKIDAHFNCDNNPVLLIRNLVKQEFVSSPRSFSPRDLT